MKVGDLVKATHGGHEARQNLRVIKAVVEVGVIIDSLEMDDGFDEHEVLLQSGEIGWFSDLMLEVISRNE